jgi:hypothetical protein
MPLLWLWKIGVSQRSERESQSEKSPTGYLSPLVLSFSAWYDALLQLRERCGVKTEDNSSATNSRR